MHIDVPVAKGGVIMHEGELYLVEEITVRANITLQKLEPLIDRFQHFESHLRRYADEAFGHNPVFAFLEGTPTDPIITNLQVLTTPKD